MESKIKASIPETGAKKGLRNHEAAAFIITEKRQMESSVYPKL